MNKFIKLIERIHKERYSFVLNKIVTEKIPVTFLNIASIQESVETVKNFRSQGLNITNLISPDPLFLETALELDFNIISLKDVSKIQPSPEYVFTLDYDWNLNNSRIAVKVFPNSQNVYMRTNIISNGIEFIENVYEIFMNHLCDLQQVYESLNDEISRRTFCGYWLGNIAHKFGEFTFTNDAHYLTSGFIPDKGAVVIDCGVCDGATSAKFKDLGYNVYGFEMDKKNFEIAKKLAEKKGFVVENLGLGSYNHKMCYTHKEGNIGGSKLDVNGNEITQIVTLDSYVRENNLPSVDFIKLDVEGAELDVLKGAVTTIAKFKPILAISAYHKWNDFWTLMNFIKSIHPDYEIILRHYVETSEDVPYLFENNLNDTLCSLGLEPDLRGGAECCFLAR